jgi:putative peptidoglycan lipid II flippase
VTVLVAVLSVAAAWKAALIANVLMPGFSDESSNVAATLLRIFLLAVVLDAVRGTLIAFYYAGERFVLPALVPSFQHIAVVAGVLWIFPAYDLAGIGWTVVIGSACMLVAMLAGRGMPRVRPTPAAFRRVEIDRVAIAVIPVTLVALSYELRQPVERWSASLIGEGAVSYLGYSSRLLQTMYACLPMAISLTYFPRFARDAAESDGVALGGSFADALRSTILVTLPIVVLVTLAGAPLLRLLFEHGEFTSDTTNAVTSTLMAHMGVFVGLAVSSLAYNVFFARRMFVPLAFIEFACLGSLIVMCRLFAPWFGYIGVALASSSIGVARAVVSMMVLARVVVIDWKKIIDGLQAGATAAAMMLGIGAAIRFAVAPESRLGLVLYLGLQGVAGILAYALVLYARGLPELVTMRGLRRREAGG